MQETKAKAAQISAFRFAAQASGYVLTASDAEGKSGARSSGVLIAWRRHLTVKTETVVSPTPRAVAVEVQSRATGTLTVVSAYLPQGSSLGDSSPAAETLHGILQPLAAEGLRAIIAGDFNQPPEKVQEWLTFHDYPFVVVSQEDHTFISATGASNIDYFVASYDVAALLRTPRVLKLSGLAQACRHGVAGE